jgi:hypothetical protein
MECCGAPPFEDTKPPTSAVASLGIIPPRTCGFQPKAPKHEQNWPRDHSNHIGIACTMPWRGMSLIWAVGKESSPLARHSLG